MSSVVQAMFSSSMIHNRVSSVFSFHLWSVAVLMLAMLSLYGCTPMPIPPVSYFYQDGHGKTLLPGEKVLQYREYLGDKVALTDERVLFNTGRHTSDLDGSVDLANIKQIGWQKRPAVILIDLYGELGTVDIDYPWNDERITQAIQSQVDYINTIRNELGISIPESVTTDELKKLNEPVIAELRARRKKAAHTTSDRLEKDASTQNECPDITGIYYDRSVSVQGDVNSRDELLCPENNNDWMPSHCSLNSWLDSMASGLSNDQRDRSPTISSCPPVRVIELVSENVLKKITAITYRDDVVLNKFTIDSESMGYRCEESRIILYQVRAGIGVVRELILYITDDGSLVIEDFNLQGGFIPPLPPIPIVSSSRIIRSWGKLENSSNPYKNCHVVFDDTYKESKSDEYLIQELTRITDAYTNNRMTKESYDRLLNYLIQDYGEDKVQKALSQL